MFIIGIDIAKRKHEAVIVDETGKIVQKAFSFANTCTGYNKLLDRVRKFSEQKEQLVFGMESTSHYWLALYTRLKREGFQVYVINPIQSDALRGLYIHQNKSDAHDSFIIAEVIRFGRFSETKVPQEKCHALRELCRNRFYLIDMVSDLKRKVIALLDQCFPEYGALFSDNFAAASIALLAKYPTPAAICKARIDTLEKLLHQASNKRFGREKAQEVKATAKAPLELRIPVVCMII